MYKVKNITKHPRKYRDNKQGKDIIIQPGKFIETNNPPVGIVWKITDIEKEKKEVNIEKKEKIKLNTQEVKNGSSSSRRCMDGDMPDSNIKTGRE